MINIALAYPDGRLGVMQFCGADHDADIQSAISKMVDRPSGWQRISEDEAAAIRAARPKPEVQLSSTPVSDVNVTGIVVQAVQEENAALKAELDELRTMFQNFLRAGWEEIQRQKAEDGT